MKDPVEVSLSLPPPPSSPLNGDNGVDEHTSDDMNKPSEGDAGTNGNGAGHHPSQIGSLGVVSAADSMRSSSSSLAKSESSDSPASALKGQHRALSNSQKKVSINEPTVNMRDVIKRESAVSPHGDKSGGHRASIIQVSADKRAKKVKFFINGDKFFKGAVIAVNNEKFRTFDKLLEHLTRIMCNQVTLPNGVRNIFSLEGRVVTDIDCLLNGESYVCSSFSTFKKLDYLSLAGRFLGMTCQTTTTLFICYVWSQNIFNLP